MVNVDLLKDTMSHIETFPELHCQGSLFEDTDFGVAACFIGRALLLSGCKYGGSYRFIRPDGTEDTRPMDEAIKLLGLTARQFSDLFHPGNTRQKLNELVTQMIETEVGSEPVSR